MIDILENYYKSRNSIFEAKEKQIDIFNKDESLMNNSSILKEIKTLHLDFGRQTGNSHFIKEKSIELFNRGKSIVIISFDMFNVKRLNQNITADMNIDDIYKNEHCIKGVGEISICSFNNVDTTLRGRSIDYVFVDVSAMLSNTTKEKIYNILIPNKNFRIISFL